MFIFVNFDTYVCICNSTSGVCVCGGGGRGAENFKRILQKYFIFDVFYRQRVGFSEQRRFGIKAYNY